MEMNKVLNLNAPNPEGFSSIGVSQFSKKTKIYINLGKNQITIITIEKLPIFEKTKKGYETFFIESDGKGYSSIRKEENQYYYVNVLDGEVIQKEPLTIEEVKEVIRSVIMERKQGGL
jgi:hypothetical protein